MASSRTVIVGGIVTVLTAVGIGYFTGRAHSPSTDPLPEPSPVSSGPSLPEATFDRDDLTWKPLSDVEVPYSQTHGPSVIEGGWSRGFARTPQGAVLAALHITFQTVEGTTVPKEAQLAALDAQVIGSYADDYAYRALSGDPLEGLEKIVVEGYQVVSYAENAAQVEIVTAVPGEHGVERAGLTFNMIWYSGDWRLVAPSSEEWAENFRLVVSLDGLELFPR